MLHLPNVMHLATDVTGVLDDGDDVVAWGSPLRCTRARPSAARRRRLPPT